MRLVATVTAILLAHAASAAEPAKSPCENFAWPMAREQAAFAAAPVEAASGTTLDALPSGAVKLALKPVADAALPVAPEKAPKDGAKAGWVVLPAPAAGLYQVTASGRFWIDAVQSGAGVKSTAHGSDPSCTLFHKVVRFDLKAEPLTLQFSGADADSVTFTILPASE